MQVNIHLSSYSMTQKIEQASVCKGGAVVRALASHQCGSGSNPGVDMWVEFVVGSLLCSGRFFSGYSGFPLSPKTNTSKFQFDLERTDTEKRALELLGASWVNKLHLQITSSALNGSSAKCFRICYKFEHLFL